MTTKPNTHIEESYMLPDPPERDPEDMISLFYLHSNGNFHHLKQHLGNLKSTIVGGEMHVELGPGERRRMPDLMVAFNSDLEGYIRRNGYVIAEQGKPPDFVLEVASKTTGHDYITRKRTDYAAMGIPEYWRFHHTGEFHREKLGGDRLSDGRYLPIPIEELEADTLQGYSQVLNLHLRWQEGELFFIDPATNAPILTYQDYQARAENEAALRIQAEAQRQQAEERIRQLEEETRRLRGH